MEALKSATSLDRFFDKLSQSNKRILFLDYDGTLAPFRKDRNKAEPYPGVVERLEVLESSRHTRLIIISGRALDDLKKLLKLKQYPELVGSHGAEYQVSGNGEVQLNIDEKTRGGLLLAQTWAIEAGLNDYCEKKLTGIAFHWRGLFGKKQKEIQEKVFAKWNENAAQYNLELHEFDGGIELRSAKVNKGLAVKNLLDGHAENAVIAYLGDDYTDEEAFEQLGKSALKVLVRENTRPTKADLHLVPPVELLGFLDRWIGVENKS